MQKPERTCGISLAILASVFWYTVVPLLAVGQLVLLQLVVPSYGFGTGEEPLFAGIEFRGISTLDVFLQVILSLAFLIIAIFAWRGKPAFSRWLLVGAVALMTLLSVGAAVQVLWARPDYSQGFDSAQGFFRAINVGRLIGSLLVALYVIWYMNRAPSRAFYRGYYLTEPPTQSPETSTPVEP